MTTALETAFPLSSNWVAATVRAKLAEQMIGVFSTPNLSAEDFTFQPFRALAIYGSGGALDLYAYDAGDTTTADDGGVSCIVVTGRRYKRQAEAIIRDAVLSATTTAQPASPSLGDAYIIPPAPSGADWASQAGTVATFTARGWLFREPFIGMVVYAADAAAFYHYNAAGVWEIGLGASALADGSIPPKKLMHPFAILKVEDQRNAPPGGTPALGTMYQVGTSPSGAFLGHSGQIARWAGAWEFIVPSEGDTIYRKDASNLFTYRVGAWAVTVQSASIFKVYVKATTATVVINSTTPTNIDSQTIQAPVGSKIRVTVSAPRYIELDSGLQLGVRIDTMSTLAAIMAYGESGILLGRTLTTIVDVPDAAAHTYSFAGRRASGGATEAYTAIPFITTWEVITPE